MNAHKFINNELDFDVMNLYTPTQEEIIGSLVEEVMQLTMNPFKKLTMRNSCTF